MNKKLFDSNASMYLLSHIMHNPSILRNTKYLLNVNDFTKRVYKLVFGVMHNLAMEGASQIHAQDVDLYIAQYQTQYAQYCEDDGLKFLNQLEQLEISDDEAQFTTRYKRVKKFTVLRELERNGVDTTDLYNPNVDFSLMKNEDEKLDNMTLDELIDKERLKLAKIEKNNINKEDEYFQPAAQGLRELVKNLRANPDIGASLEGDMFNSIAKGARRGKMYLLSAPQSHGKTRMMIANACRLSMPRIVDGNVVINGPLQKVMYIATEQLPEEIQTMILAYVSGVNEEKIIYGQGITSAEEKLLEQATEIIEKYSNNLYIDMLSSPTIPQLKSRILEQVLDKNLDAVFYDYIFIPSEDGNNNRNFRNDQLLMLMGAALKDIAAAYDIFMFTATQVSGQWEGAKVRNQNMIRDAKSLADKPDICYITVQVSDEEYSRVEPYFKDMGLMRPNIVSDIYKNRRGSITNVKIWSYFDYGTCRMKDLLVTTQSYKMIDNVPVIAYKESKVVDLLDFLTRPKGEVK